MRARLADLAAQAGNAFRRLSARHHWCRRSNVIGITSMSGENVLVLFITRLHTSSLVASVKSHKGCSISQSLCSNTNGWLRLHASSGGNRYQHNLGNEEGDEGVSQFSGAAITFRQNSLTSTTHQVVCRAAKLSM